MNGAKILIVDDRRENLFVLESLLEDLDVELVRAESGNEALARVLDHDFALVLLDVQMPGMDGYEVAALLRGSTKTRHIPIIFVTARYKEQTNIFQGYDAGAVDYLFKPLESVILKSKVNVFLELYQQKVELKQTNRELDRRLADLEELQRLLEQTNEQLARQSKIDGLTGVFNRRSFDEIFAQEWRRGRRNGLPLSLLLIDIDFFKGFNDTYGHVHGDDALKAVAKALTMAAKRHIDRVARYGGEEFVVILPETDLKGAELMAQRICSVIRDLNIEHRGSPAQRRLTVSVGATTVYPAANNDPMECIDAADGQMYAAKSAGRNCWRSAPYGDRNFLIEGWENG